MALKELNFPFHNFEENILLTREETAKILSISLTTLWTWDKDDIFQSYRIGGKVRF